MSYSCPGSLKELIVSLQLYLFADKNRPTCCVAQGMLLEVCWRFLSATASTQTE